MLANIVCKDIHNGIGKDNRIPWKFPEDMKFFRETTTGNTIIMGRKTYESIGKPLPNRRNIVLSRTFEPTSFDGFELYRSVEDVLKVLNPEEKSFVIGGGEIFSAFLPHITHQYITTIPHNYHCDAYYPEFPWSMGDIWVTIEKTILSGKITVEVLEKRKRLVLDFDGVLHQHVSPFTTTLEIHDPPVPGAIEKLKEYLKVFHVTIWSARNYYEGVGAIKDWLVEHGITPGELSQIEFPRIEKPLFHLYLCDNSQKFEGVFPSVEEIKSHGQWNKK